MKMAIEITQAIGFVVVMGVLLLTVDWLLERWERRSDERWWQARREPWQWSDARRSSASPPPVYDWKERRWL